MLLPSWSFTAIGKCKKSSNGGFEGISDLVADRDTAYPRYYLDHRLDTLALRHDWLREVSSEMPRQPAATFLKPEFYGPPRAGLLEKADAPGALLQTNALFRAVGRSRALLHRTVRSRESMPAALHQDED